MDQEATERECPVCGTVYVARIGRLKWGRETTCSRACSYRLRSQGLEAKVSMTCAVCGREFSRKPSSVKGKHGGQFCSRACHYAGRERGVTKRVVTKPYVISDAARVAWKIGAQKARATRIARNNYVQSDATRAKLPEATARALAQGRPYIISKLEHIVAKELDALGIAYDRQHFFRGEDGRFCAVCDFWFAPLNAVMEVNGTYWHVDPRTYPTPVNAMQKRSLARYRRKIESLKARGIRVVEVWEADLKQRPAQAVLEAYAQLSAG